MVNENRNDFNEIAEQLDKVLNTLVPHLTTVRPETVTMTKDSFIASIVQLQKLKNWAKELGLLYQNRSDRVETEGKAAQGEPMIPMSLTQWEIIRANLEEAQNSIEYAYHALPEPKPIDESKKPPNTKASRQAHERVAGEILDHLQREQERKQVAKTILSRLRNRADDGDSAKEAEGKTNDPA